MWINPNFKSDTGKILAALGLDKDFKDRYRTEYGSIVIEHIESKKTFDIPESMIAQIMKERGAFQKILLDHLKKIILSHDPKAQIQKNQKVH